MVLAVGSRHYHQKSVARLVWQLVLAGFLLLVSLHGLQRGKGWATSLLTLIIGRGKVITHPFMWVPRGLGKHKNEGEGQEQLVLRADACPSPERVPREVHALLYQRFA